MHATRDNTQGIIPDQLLDTTTGTDTGIAGRDHSHTLIDIKVIVTIIHAEVIHDHITDAITEALHDIVTPALIATTMTHHTKDHHQVEVYQPTPEIIAGPDHTHHTNQVQTSHLNLHSVPVGQQ